MQTIAKILCPTDFSPSAIRAVNYAEQLARETNAELFLLNVFCVPESWSLSGQEHPRDPRVEREISKVLSDSTINQRIHRLIHAGDAGEVICWTAQ